MIRTLVATVALCLIALSVWQLEADRAGLTIAALRVEGGTPATLYLRDGGRAAPVVVVAHGFAGSRQLMDPFALTLAQAGYTVASFDFMGHGRNPAPMSGDVTAEDGTTRLLMDEVRRVARAALAHPRADGRLAYLGHSMASDVVVRAAVQDPQADAVVGVSMFSRQVTPEAPSNVLIITGDWEARLKQEALRVIALSNPDAGAGDLVGDFADGTARQAVFAPMVEHVGVLYSGTALAAARDWLDASFERQSSGEVPLRGGWIVLLMASVVALSWPLARLMPAARPGMPAALTGRQFWAIALLPAIVTPLALWPFDTRFLPVLVADYLALHFALYGALTLALLARAGALRGAFPARVWPLALGVAAFGILVFGGALDRYVASFMPHMDRVWIIAALALGAVPFMLGDAFVTGGGQAALGRVLVARLAFVLSLMAAVALDTERLFFLLIILPVIVLFFILFGVMAGFVGRRTGLPGVAGLGLGVVLAWALGVSFPIFAA